MSNKIVCSTAIANEVTLESGRINIANTISTLAYINSSVENNQIKLSPTPDGTVTYDSATGAITDFTTDVDPKYGDVASTTNEAVARAFEGVVKNGDFRLAAPQYWQTLGGASISDGELVLPSNGEVSYAFYEFDDLIGNEFEISVNIKQLPSGASCRVYLGESSTEQFITSEGFHTFNATPTSDGRFQIQQVLEGAESTIVSHLSFRPITNQVVTERVDMFGLEAWLEEITAANPYAYPLGLIQSQASTFEGLSTSTSSRTVSYYAVYDGDTSSQGKGRDFFNATTAEKEVMLSNPEHNIYFEKETGKWLQWRIRQRTIAGAGNGDWQYTEPTGLNYLRYDAKAQVKLQGINDLVSPYATGSSATWSALATNNSNALNVNAEEGVFASFDSTALSYNGECYFYVIGTVPRLNQGAYHPSLNPMGAGKLNSDTLTFSGALWSDASAIALNSLADALNPVEGTLDNTSAGYVVSRGFIGTQSGRPDSRYYDAIYASGLGGVIDDRPKYGAWGASSSEQASEVWQEVVSGEYRGREKLKLTTVYNETQTSNLASSNIIWVDEASPYSLGDTISVVRNSSLVLSEGIVSEVGTNYIRFDLTYSSPIETVLNEVLQVVHTAETDTTIESEFLQTDVIGDPANILLTDALKDGWLGGWIPVIPDGTSQEYELTRKSLDSSVTQVYSLDAGASWSSSLLSISTITNGWVSTNSASLVNTLNYTAAAHQTEQSENLPVLHGGNGLGGVLLSDWYLHQEGSLLSESTLDVILKANTSMVKSNHMLSDVFINSANMLLNAAAYYPRHSQLRLAAPNNDSHGLKALPHQISENNQANLNVIANELIHDGTDWGDDSTVKIIEDGTYTNLNGDTCKSVIHKLAKPYGWVKNNI